MTEPSEIPGVDYGLTDPSPWETVVWDFSPRREAHRKEMAARKQRRDEMAPGVVVGGKFRWLSFAQRHAAQRPLRPEGRSANKCDLLSTSMSRGRGVKHWAKLLCRGLKEKAA